MTVGQRRRRKTASVNRSFTMTDKQKAKMHEAAQLQLFQMSDVQGQLHKKQPSAASRKRRGAERPQHSICAGAHDQPQVRRKRRNIPLKEKTFLKKKEKDIDKERIEEVGNASGGFEYLLILANSAELMESEGRSYMEKPPEPTQVYGDVETEESLLRVRGRVRLTQIRQRARLENSQQIHNTNVGEVHEHDTIGCNSVYTNQARAMDHQNDQGRCYMEQPPESTQDSGDVETEENPRCVRGRVRLTQIRQRARLENSQQMHNTNGGEVHEHPNLTLCEDTSGCKSVYTEQARAMDHQNDQDSHVLAKNGNTGIADIRLLESESVEVNNEMLEQSVEPDVTISQPALMTAEHGDVTISQPALMTAEHGKFTEELSGAHHLRIANTSDPLKAHFLNEKQEHRHAPLIRHEISTSLIKKPEAAKVRRNIARERRKMRVFERRKQRHNSHMQWLYSIHMRQMFEAQQWWLWHVMNATGQFNDLAKHHNDLAKHHRSLHMSFVEREQRRVSARQRRAEKIEEKRALRKMQRPLKNSRPVECHSEEVSHNSDVRTGVEQTAILVKEHPTIPIVSEDPCGKSQQKTTNVNYEEKSSLRLAQLKHEVRLKHSAAVQMEKLTQQMDRGNEFTGS